MVKTHALNVYSQDETKRFKVTVQSDKTTLSGDGSPIEIDTSLVLGAVSNVEAAILAAQADLIGAGQANNTVALALSDYQSSNNTALAVERARLDDLLASTNLDLDQLHEIITAYTTSDASMLAQITTMNGQLQALQAAFNSLTEE